MRHPARVRKIARDRFGYAQLWPGQEEAIVSVLEGRDTLVAMPARSGKSAIYRVPALMLPGPTVVVSPASVVPEDAPDISITDLPFLFLTVTQLDGQTVDLVRSARPSLFVVYEAQCPAHLELGPVIAAVGRPLIVALTDTPNPAVRMEIISRLGMRDPAVIVRGFDRPSVFASQAG